MGSLATIPSTSTPLVTWLTWRNALQLQSQSSVTQSMPSCDVYINFGYFLSESYHKDLNVKDIQCNNPV